MALRGDRGKSTPVVRATCARTGKAVVALHRAADRKAAALAGAARSSRDLVRRQGDIRQFASGISGRASQMSLTWTIRVALVEAL
jgi:hypothetical protein